MFRRCSQPLCVTCQVSHVICQVSCVALKIYIIIRKKEKIVELVGGRSVINGATPLSFFLSLFFYQPYYFAKNIPLLPPTKKNHSHLWFPILKANCIEKKPFTPL